MNPATITFVAICVFAGGTSLLKKLKREVRPRVQNPRPEIG